MAFAINIQTESSDNYLILMEGEPTQEQIISEIKSRIGDEFDYISNYDYESTYGIKIKLF